MPRQFTPDDLVNFRVPFDVQLAPDASRIAFVRGATGKPDKDTPPPSAIFLTDAETGHTRRFAGDDQTASDSPRWSPDGTRLALCSNRTKKDEAQLFVIDLHGGEAQALTDLRGSVHNPTWFPDGQQIAFLYSGTLDKQKPPTPDPVVQDADPHFNRVWIVDSTSREVRALTPEKLNVYEYALSHDGRSLVLVAAPEASNEAWYTAQLYVADVASGEARKLCTFPHQLGEPVWSPDDQQIAFIGGVMSDQGAVAGEIYSVPAAGGEATNLSPGLDHSPTWLAWLDEDILYCAHEVAQTTVGWLDVALGTERTIWRGPGSIGGRQHQALSIAPKSRTFAALFTDFTTPTNIYFGSLDSDELRKVTDLFPELAEYPTPHVETEIWWLGDGTPVQGYLVYPNDYQTGQRYPLVVIVHGGPSALHAAGYGLNAWEWRHLLAARGCFVLLPNPRGSWGRGHAYQSANVGDLGGGDWQDINTGLDHVIGRGLVDPDRLAIVGWSYGGYMTAWAVTQTDRFKCAVAGAAITNYESNYGVVSIRGWQTALFGKIFYEDSERQRSRSPMTFASRVKTPTLLLHGERDEDVPAEQSLEFYTALKHFGIPVQLVTYPREPHGFRERTHQLDLIQRIMGWLEKYLTLT